MKTLSLFLSLSIVLLPLYAYTEPKTTMLKKTEKAPYDGVLLNSEAQAKLIAEKKEKERLCKLEKDFLSMRAKATCQRSMSNLKIDLNIANKKYDSIIKIKDNEIQRLQEIALKKKSSNKGWWIGLGALGGIVVTVATFLLVSQVRKVGQ